MGGGGGWRYTGKGGGWGYTDNKVRKGGGGGGGRGYTRT